MHMSGLWIVPVCPHRIAGYPMPAAVVRELHSSRTERLLRPVPEHKVVIHQVHPMVGRIGGGGLPSDPVAIERPPPAAPCRLCPIHGPFHKTRSTPSCSASELAKLDPIACHDAVRTCGAAPPPMRRPSQMYGRAGIIYNKTSLPRMARPRWWPGGACQ